MSWKLSRTVLRGAVGGNADCLLDTHDDPKNERPFAFDLENGKMMAFAGLWDAWKDPLTDRGCKAIPIEQPGGGARSSADSLNHHIDMASRDGSQQAVGYTEQ